MSKGIYKIENLQNGKIYIGQSIHIEKRWQEHCQPSSNSLISQAIKEFGKDNFSFEIIEEVDDIEKLTEKEIYYIQNFNSVIPNGYNVSTADGKHKHVFAKYPPEILQNIVNDIKNSQLTFNEISQKYSLDISMIYYINRGDYHTFENETYPLRPVKDFSKQNHYCVDCGILLKTNSQRCVDCAHKAQRKVSERPERDLLKQLIRTKTFMDIGRSYGVRDNTIRKWCKAYGLPTTKKEINQMTNKQWKNI